MNKKNIIGWLFYLWGIVLVGIGLIASSFTQGIVQNIFGALVIVGGCLGIIGVVSGIKEIE